MVAYWHWHSIHAGNEMFWKGILSHDLEPNRVYGEMSRVGRELREVGPALVNLKKRNQVAILYSVDSFHALEETVTRDVTRALESGGFESRLLLQVHDELVLELAPAELKQAARIVQQVMESAYALSIPLLTEAKSGTHWGNLVSIS